MFDNAVKQVPTNDLVINFASAVSAGMGVYIMESELRKRGADAASNRNAQLGWALFDFPETQFNTNIYGYVDIVDLWIDSNFGYSTYPNQFTII